MYYAYNGYLRFIAMVDHPDDCPPGCEVTEEEPPPTPWPDGTWPYYLDAGWELVKIDNP